MYWMDISRDDEGEVMSVVAGCDACTTRTIGNTIGDARLWISRHSENIHDPADSRATRQIGDYLTSSKQQPYRVKAAAFIAAKRTVTTQELADELQTSPNSAFQVLNRMEKGRTIRKIKQGNKVRWEALEAGTEALESKIAVAVAPELVKPAERLLQPYYGNPDILQGFGAHEEVYKRFGFQGHMGLDIGIAMQPVLAAHDGIVEFAGDGGEWPIMGAAAGTCILLDGDTLRTGYAHLRHSYMGIGDEVKAGDVIAISGDTGATTGFHLHFEVLPKPTLHNNGYAGRVDPTPYLNAPTPIEAPL